jgi:uncharacterized membrane protein YqhA
VFIAGGVTTIQAVRAYLSTGEHEAFSADAVLEATIEVVRALDQFLLGLVLLVFAFGIFSLFLSTEGREERERIGEPEWLQVTSVGELKIKLLETVSVLLAVLFLKGTLKGPANASLEWRSLVGPLAVALFALTDWFIRTSGSR